MATLREQLADTEAAAETLRQRIAAEESCGIRSHRWEFTGGCNAAAAGCTEEACGCSVPVHTCTDCGDCDYGDTEEGRSIVAECLERHG
jgi:hypothetical protein